MGGIAGEDAAEKVGRLAVFGHSTAGSVGDGDDAIDVGVGAEELWGEVGSNAACDGSGAVDGGENTNVIAGGDATVGAEDASESSEFRGRYKLGGAGFGADGIVALEIACDEVMGVNVFPDGDGLGGEANDLVELTDGLARGDGTDREFVAGGDVGERSKL